MDKQARTNDVSDELTRERLIAISSYESGSSNAQPQPPRLDANVKVVNNEKYISELISISDAQPSDALPVGVTHKERMAKQARTNDVSDELTHERLIAISSYESDSSSAQLQPPRPDANVKVVDNEKYISDLISISDAQPSNALPAGVTHKGQ